MNPIDLLEPELSARLIQTLGHFLWEGAAVAAVVIVIWPMLRLASSDLRYRICLSALAILAACPALTFIALQPASSPASPAPAAHLQSDREPIRLPRLVDAVPAPVLTPGRATRSSQAKVVTVDRKTSLYQTYLLTAYFAGVALMLARLAFAVGAIHRLRRRAAPASDPALLAAIARATEALRLRAAPLVAVCARASAPAVVGVLRPIILLPLSVATELSPQQLQAILAHEMAHLRRADHLVLVLQRLIESLLFFHPAVWFISRRLSVERENCCDDIVVAAGGGPVTYADSLVRVAELCREREGAMALASTSTNLSRRVRRLLDPPAKEGMSAGGGAVVVVAAIVAMVAVAVPNHAASRLHAGPVPAPASTAASRPTSREIEADDQSLQFLIVDRTAALMAIERSLRSARQSLAAAEAGVKTDQRYTAEEIGRADSRMLAKLQARDELALKAVTLRAEGYSDRHPDLRRVSAELHRREQDIDQYTAQFNQKYLIIWRTEGTGWVPVERELGTLKAMVRQLQEERDEAEKDLTQIGRRRNGLRQLAATQPAAAEDEMIAAGADFQAVVTARTQNLMALEKALKDAKVLLVRAEQDRRRAAQSLVPADWATPEEIAKVDRTMADKIAMRDSLKLKLMEREQELGPKHPHTLEVRALVDGLGDSIASAAKEFNQRYSIQTDGPGQQPRIVPNDPAVLRERIRRLEAEYNEEKEALGRLHRGAAGHASGNVPAEAVEVEDCVVSPQRLASGVIVSASQGEGGGYEVKLSGPAATRKYYVVRGASFYGLRDAPGVVLLHDRRAANEDAIVVLDLLRPGANPVRIGHDDSGSYLHLHFGRPRVNGTQMTFIESEWTGDEQDSPRSRTVTLSLRPPLGKEAAGAWETSGQRP